ncbi:MAG: ATP-dependent DNA helicase RecG [Clostridia bacterium]|nr:ATP-dependent DNA helicase RecG [Clostridia bacterium]
MNLLQIKGIGAKTVEKLNKLGIYTLFDLIEFLPRKYWDMTEVSDLDNTLDGEYALLKGTIASVTKVQYIRRSMNVFKAYLYTQGKKVTLTWFNSPYLRDKLDVGQEYIVWGKVYRSARSVSLNNPSFELEAESTRLKGIVPIYPIKNYITQPAFVKYVAQALQSVTYDSLLDLSTQRMDMSLSNAYYIAHNPSSLADVAKARKRIDKEKLIAQLIAHRFNKQGEERISKRYTISPDTVNDCIAQLPYRLSESQSVALGEIISDLMRCDKMNRMLSGDVGSGKTVVALLSALYAIKCGYQVAMMAPTEILARQHYNTANAIFSTQGLNIELLTGESSTAEKRRIYNAACDGKIDLIIGTHAVISDKIKFNDLGLIIVDELQRFGVRHKSALENKAKGVDVLVMSATPIPRAIALTELGDLTLSSLEPRYDYAQNKITKVIGDSDLDKVYGFIRDIVGRGEQAYIVCPLVEDSEGLERISVKKLYASLVADKLRGISVALVYSGMKENIKNKIMTDFYEGNISVLVATTVIEVGIDCPRATAMIVLNADSFGLSTLHQLRGRVGRREGQQAYCFLHTSIKGACERLNAMSEISDGYAIAEVDAAMRGLGDFIGVRQSGVNNMFTMIDKDFIRECRVIADDIYANNLDNALNYNCVKGYIDISKQVSLS